MSLINKVLQDLDRREATAATPGDSDIRPATPASRRGRLVLVALAAVAIGAGVWAWRARPTKSVNEGAFQPVPKQKPALPPQAAPAPRPDIAYPAAPPMPREEPPPAPPQASEPPTVTAKAQPSARAPAPKTSTRKPRRQSTAAPADPAEKPYLEAVTLLNEGRVSEAEEGFVAALRINPSHAASRQAYVALLMEQGRLDEAQRLLREALSSDPSQAVFALALARIYTQQRDYAASLEVLDRAGSAAAGFEPAYLRGVDFERMGRNAEAADAFRSAIAAEASSAIAWMGLAIALEKLRQDGDAAEAYRRALSLGPMKRELRDYAESRLRALQ